MKISVKKIIISFILFVLLMPILESRIGATRNGTESSPWDVSKNRNERLDLRGYRSPKDVYLNYNVTPNDVGIDQYINTSNSRIFLMNSSERVTAAEIGEGIMTVAEDDQPSRISLNKTQMRLNGNKKDSELLVRLYPESNTEHHKITWESSNSSIANINQCRSVHFWSLVLCKWGKSGNMYHNS